MVDEFLEFTINKINTVLSKKCHTYKQIKAIELIIGLKILFYAKEEPTLKFSYFAVSEGKNQSVTLSNH